MFDIEFLDLPPLNSAAGTVSLPGSKSISNRVLLLAALCEGETVIHDLLDSDDTQVMLKALSQLGCGVSLHGTTCTLRGVGAAGFKKSAKLFMGNAGTAMRPLTAALALMGGDYELSGVPRMHERPIGDLVDALSQVGCSIEYLGVEGYPPLRIGARTKDQNWPSILVRGDVSSQFLTALLLALPRVGESFHIDVQGELISKPYVEITLNLLRRFGINLQNDNWRNFVIFDSERYESPKNIYVEADASSASYFIALGGIAASADAPLRIEGVGADSIQGDIRFVEAAQAMGVIVKSEANALTVHRGAWPLKAIDLDCNHIPDAAMTLAVMALYADGVTTLKNIASWRVKETDRIAAMEAELRKLGATVVSTIDSIQIWPIRDVAQWKSASIHTYDDHRIAMCFSLAAFNPAHKVVRILDPKCVAKTFPNYFETFFSISK